MYRSMYNIFAHQQDRAGSSQEQRLQAGSGRYRVDMGIPVLESVQGGSSILWDTVQASQ